MKELHKKQFEFLIWLDRYLAKFPGMDKVISVWDSNEGRYRATTYAQYVNKVVEDYRYDEQNIDVLNELREEYLKEYQTRDESKS